MSWIPVPRESFVPNTRSRRKEEPEENRTPDQKISDSIPQEHVPKRTSWKELLILMLIVLGACWGMALILTCPIL